MPLRTPWLHAPPPPAQPAASAPPPTPTPCSSSSSSSSAPSSSPPDCWPHSPLACAAACTCSAPQAWKVRHTVSTSWSRRYCMVLLLLVYSCNEGEGIKGRVQPARAGPQRGMRSRAGTFGRRRGRAGGGRRRHTSRGRFSATCSSGVSLSMAAFRRSRSTTLCSGAWHRAGSGWQGAPATRPRRSTAGREPAAQCSRALPSAAIGDPRRAGGCAGPLEGSGAHLRLGLRRIQPHAQIGIVAWPRGPRVPCLPRPLGGALRNPPRHHRCRTTPCGRKAGGFGRPATIEAMNRALAGPGEWGPAGSVRPAGRPVPVRLNGALAGAGSLLFGSA